MNVRRVAVRSLDKVISLNEPLWHAKAFLLRYDPHRRNLFFNHKLQYLPVVPNNYTMQTHLLIYVSFLASLSCTAASSKSPSLALVRQYWPFHPNGGSEKAPIMN